MAALALRWSVMANRDPDDYRDSVICDGVPDHRWGRSHEAVVAQLRARIGRLWARLASLDLEATLPPIAEDTGDVESLRGTVRDLERRIGQLLGKSTA
jgi:hypothetical protein